MMAAILMAAAIAAPAARPAPAVAAAAARTPSATALGAARVTPGPSSVPPPPPVAPPPAAPPPAALPPAPSAALKALAGAWRLADVGGKIDCTLTLSDHADPSGRAIEAPLACRRAFPPLNDLTVCSAGAHGASCFTGPRLKRPLQFSGPPGGPFSAVSPDGKPWRLTAAPAKGVAVTAH